jgi:CRISPR-associated endoribonuclease Cas6
MRLKIKFTANTSPVPNNLNVVNSYIHKCLGENNPYHDAKSDYNVSKLLGGIVIDGGRTINYSNGGYILVSSMNNDFLNKIITGTLSNQDFGYGMKFNGLDTMNETFYTGKNYFKTTDGGFMLKKPENYVYDENDKHKGYYTLNDKDINTVLKNHIISKFSKINPKLRFDDLDVQIQENKGNKVAYRYSNNIRNSVNICQIQIITNKTVAELIYNYGLGQSCGSGFGTVYTTQLHKHLFK